MFKLSESGLQFVKKEMARYESRESAIIPCLFHIQKENGGWINTEVIDCLSDIMEIPAAKIESVFSFYTMFNKKPVGKYHIQVCTNISCSLNGGRELCDHILKYLGVKIGEVTSDGKFSVNDVECLGACGMAPMMQINEDYYENLTPELAIEILQGMK